MKGTIVEFKKYLSFEKLFKSKKRSPFPLWYPVLRNIFAGLKPLTPFTQYRHMVYCSLPSCRKIGSLVGAYVGATFIFFSLFKISYLNS